MMNVLKTTLLNSVLCFILIATTTLPANAQLSENALEVEKAKSPNSLTEVIKQRSTVIRSMGNFVKLVSILSDTRLRDLPKNITTKFIEGGTLAGRRIKHPEIKAHFRAGFGFMIQLISR